MMKREHRIMTAGDRIIDGIDVLRDSRLSFREGGKEKKEEERKWKAVNNGK